MKKETFNTMARVCVSISLCIFLITIFIVMGNIREANEVITLNNTTMYNLLVKVDDMPVYELADALTEGELKNLYEVAKTFGPNIKFHYDGGDLEEYERLQQSVMRKAIGAYIFKQAKGYFSPKG
jgi:hypothetical protein